MVVVVLLFYVLLLLFLFFIYFIYFISSFDTGAGTNPSSIGAGSSTAAATYAGTDRVQPSGTDPNSSGVTHKTITIPNKVPKKGKLLFFVLFNMVALIFFY